MTNSPWTIELGDLDRKMGIEVLEQSAKRVVATMPVAGNTQSFGLLHGGASMAFGEALGSWAAVIHASTIGKSAVGLDINGTHVRGVRSGVITGVATAIHLGNTIASHEVVLTDESGALISTIRITNLLIPAPAG
ncbi:PaaI family thioesterase [Lysinimonas soli]|uniref:PaaI family thioesterase n=1 Tax=Lysinimonas soli TaxID=1074233 RepID=A0ABW0NLF3_9MICO